MKYNTLPRTDLSVSQLCFGTWGIATDFHWGERDQQESEQAILAAVESGVNFFDTAPVYANGESETLLGTLFSANHLRQKTVIASKVPPDKMKPDEIPAECEASLRRLRTDYLDLYQTHWTDREVPLAETWGAMQRLQEQGKVRHIGVCNMGLSDMREVSLLQRPVTNQLPYNLLWRMIEAEILPRCVADEIGVLPYSPLMHGMLADKYKNSAEVPNGRARSRHFTTDRPLARHGETGCEKETFAALDSIREIRGQIDRSMANVALAWIIHQPGVVSVIVGARNAQQSRENVRVLDSPLGAEIVQQLCDATQELYDALGDNPDMWDGGENSRYR